MTDANAEPRPLIPALKPFYTWVIPLTWPLIRIAVGWNLVVHAWGKLQRGMGAVLPGFSQLGFEPAWLFGWSATLIELLGGIGHHPRPVHPVFRRRGGNRDVRDLLRLLGQRL